MTLMCYIWISTLKKIFFYLFTYVILILFSSLYHGQNDARFTNGYSVKCLFVIIQYSITNGWTGTRNPLTPLPPQCRLFEMSGASMTTVQDPRPRTEWKLSKHINLRLDSF
jgi:hypothetical protein